eukprot:TRINITY_DN590_c0_g1_i1.p1 TRINITY_DN590_c0_g1~~TRINITY_DN590_c0_g1_i1.p1  ORF type:complete len:292 (+),score=15.08 TRINITY_DN590_c0_g1_i1:151-1026(+)
MKLFCCMFNKIEAAKLDFEKSWVFMFNGHVVTKVELMGTVSSIRMSSRGIWEIIIMDETSKAFCTRARDLEEKINLGDLVMCHGSVTKARPWLRSKVQNELCLFSIQKVSDANAEIEWMHDVMKTTAAHSAHPRETIIGSRKQTIGELFEHWGGHIRSSGNSFTMQDSLGILVLEVLSRYGGKKCFLNLIMLKSQLDNALGKNASLLIKILRTLNNYGDVVFSGFFFCDFSNFYIKIPPLGSFPKILWKHFPVESVLSQDNFLQISFKATIIESMCATCCFHQLKSSFLIG